MKLRMGIEFDHSLAANSFHREHLLSKTVYSNLLPAAAPSEVSLAVVEEAFPLDQWAHNYFHNGKRNGNDGSVYNSSDIDRFYSRIEGNVRSVSLTT